MKIRLMYVSNSSSSSSLVLEDLTSKGIACMKLSETQKKLINGSKVYFDSKIIELDMSKDYYLTQFVSDCDDKKYNLIKNIEHIEYANGDLGEEPYSNDMFNEYQIDGDRSIYILKKHDEAKQMKFNKFVKEFKKAYSNVDVLIKYDDKGIHLTIIE